MFHWQYTPIVEDINPIKKIKTTKNKVHLKNDCNFGSVSNGNRRPKIFGFDLNKLPGFETFFERETKH